MLSYMGVTGHGIAAHVIRFTRENRRHFAAFAPFDPEKNGRFVIILLESFHGLAPLVQIDVNFKVFPIIGVNLPMACHVRKLARVVGV